MSGYGYGPGNADRIEIGRLRAQIERENTVQLTARDVGFDGTLYTVKFKGFTSETRVTHDVLLRMSAEDHREFLQREIAHQFANAVTDHVVEAFKAMQRTGKRP